MSHSFADKPRVLPFFNDCELPKACRRVMQNDRYTALFHEFSSYIQLFLPFNRSMASKYTWFGQHKKYPTLTFGPKLAAYSILWRGIWNLIGPSIDTTKLAPLVLINKKYFSDITFFTIFLIEISVRGTPGSPGPGFNGKFEYGFSSVDSGVLSYAQCPYQELKYDICCGVMSLTLC